ncbi:hypothetical protein [Burkholderia cepacia]|uniref:PIN domain-containing protein n=1 Tax=Burkholderia cepacia TaxID=292 RepID=A0A8I1ATW2_BURCE|nr:hypothetical protein [Burkholderia cepacia]MBH9682845.1 hypothetical protein [Burkholderia cepacia]MBH9696936.1 hypothetical protein [Burkholderia cepacia]MBH9713284.1 hypothetical protein [Burkholderia cepacia]MBH9733959.1 hypothetical protein [Burkholderia cepacia]MBX3760386.1 hypothetical protein [Burkholderia cepacia]
MHSPFLLDTNAYALLFEYPRTELYSNLKDKITVDGVMKFRIPDIVSMEIHSVIGARRRGGNNAQNQACDRHVQSGDEVILCTHTCVFRKNHRLKPKMFRDIQKLIKDIESKSGDIQADIIPSSSEDLIYAKSLLITYADRYAFGSHDALVGGVVLGARKKGDNLTLVTSDKALKAVCNAEGIPVFDPRTPNQATALA